MISYGENIFRQLHPKKSAISKESVLKNLTTTPEAGFDSLAAFLKITKPKQPWKTQLTKGLMLDAVGDGRPVYVIGKTDEIQNDVPVFISYLQTDSGARLELVYSYQVRLKGNWYHAHVNAQSDKVEALIDWVADATAYEVLPINAIDIQENKRRIIKAHPQKNASPYGWHSNGDRSNRDTRGNNVWAQQNTYSERDIGNLYRPTGDYKHRFDFPFDSKSEPIRNRDASITQLFYTCNVLHDILYQYGFDEMSGNFQDNNGNKGGRGGDFIIANALVEVGIDNADFATPPDGESGIMRMFLWYETSPARDGAFDMTVVIHEYGHGLSDRLTGGPHNTDCLSTLEAGGMGEGWSDALVLVCLQKPSSKRTDVFPMTVYAYGTLITKYPYSTNLTINPSLYSYIDQSEDYAEVHMKGEVWTVILFEVYWNLVDRLGFTSDLYSASLTKGNTLFLQVMINAMKLQPCNPTFLQARDAFLQAETLLTNGTYACDIWRGFAKRGRGFNARKVKNQPKHGFRSPPRCR